MENQITLKNKWPYFLSIGIALLGFSVLMAELIVHYSAKHRKPLPEPVVVKPMQLDQVLLTVYQDANKYFLGDKTKLNQTVYTYCSAPLIEAFSKTPGIMVQTFARETRIGKLKKVEVISQDFHGPDSSIVSARATYKDGSSKNFKQIMIKEDGHWKLGLSYGRNIK